jgi:epoxide hydrolase 4
MTLHKTKVRGLDTAWIQLGKLTSKRPIMFFLHGFPDSPQTWVAQLEEFSKPTLVVAPFLRGLRPSEIGNVKRFSPQNLVKDCQAILKYLDPKSIHEVVVVGHDVGGMLAWEWARQLKHRLSSLVVINGPALDQMFRRILNLRQLRKSWYIGFFQIPKLPEWVMRQWGNSIIQRLRSNQGASALNLKTEHLIPLIHIYRQSVKSLLKRRASNQKVKAPVLVLWSEKDLFLEVPTVPELQKIASDFTIRVLNEGHWVHEAQAGRVNRLMKTFLESIS